MYIIYKYEGYSATTPSLWAMMGYDAMVLSCLSADFSTFCALPAFNTNMYVRSGSIMRGCILCFSLTPSF